MALLCSILAQSCLEIDSKKKRKINYRAQGTDVQPAEIIFLTWEFIELNTFTATDLLTI